jgi:hypothetical protein
MTEIVPELLHDAELCRVAHLAQRQSHRGAHIGSLTGQQPLRKTTCLRNLLADQTGSRLLIYLAVSENRSSMRDFNIEDPDGNLIGIGQESKK